MVSRVTWEYVSVSRSVVRVWTTVLCAVRPSREPSSILSASEGIIGFAHMVYLSDSMGAFSGVQRCEADNMLFLSDYGQPP